MRITKQIIFDRVAQHLLTQYERAVGMDGRCSYRGKGGTMCAIGCLIHGDFYNTAFEGAGVDDHEVMLAVMKSLRYVDRYEVSARDLTGMSSFLSYLQDIHDGSHVADWAKQLKLLADREGLEFNPPEPPYIQELLE